MNHPILLLMSFTLLTGCNEIDSLLHFEHQHEQTEHKHDHADHDHGTGDHHEHESEAHHDDNNWVITHFTEETELFVEFPPLVTNQSSEFAAHLTKLDGFHAVASGRVTVTLSGGGFPDETFIVNEPQTAGIFRPIITPKYATTRYLSLRLEAESLDINHALGTMTVFELEEDAIDDMPIVEEASQPIYFLKETQWQVEFALAKAITGELKASTAATGSLQAASDRQTHITATSPGHLLLDANTPHVGMQVKQGQLLASLSPKMAHGTDLTTLKATRDKARSAYQLATYDRQRLEKLWQNKAIAERRLQAAKNKETVAKTELDAAESRLNQATGKTHRDTGIPIYAPIDGVIVEAGAIAGQQVHEGQLLFHIVNHDKLWLEARIAEVDIAKIQQANAAWFSIEGIQDSFDTASLNGRVIANAGLVDPVSRTVPLIFEFDNPKQLLRAGMYANVRVFTGEKEQGVVVPSSAVFDDGGQNVVYVQLGGESYQRRIVKLGIKQGDDIILKNGVNAGEYVVSRGAYQLRLASSSPAEAGHGHAH